MAKHKQAKRGRRTLTYNSWRAMKGRMLNPNNWKWGYYGGAGLKSEPRWHTFALFFADMGRRPRRSYTLDRIDCSKGYSKENCRWATRAQQQANRRKPLKLWTQEDHDNYAAMIEAFS